MPFTNPYESESPTQPNSNSGGSPTDDLAEFLPLGPVNLIRLGEDLLHTHPIYYQEHPTTIQDQKYVSSISNVIPWDKPSPTDLSSEEATALAETFREVHSPAGSPPSL